MSNTRYRKIPVVIEAFQYDGDLIGSDGKFYVPEWAEKAFDSGDMYFDAPDPASPPSELFIKTLEGLLHVSVDDYIIKGVNGELYPCKADIFAKTYEVADNTQSGLSAEDMALLEELRIDFFNVHQDSIYNRAIRLINRLTAELADMTRERDAAVSDLSTLAINCEDCHTCVHGKENKNDCCAEAGPCGWNWRGVQAPDGAGGENDD